MKRNWTQHIKQILLHITFWVGVWFFYFYFFSYNSNDYNYIIWFSSCLLPLTMSVTYFVDLVLIPKYLLTRQYKQFVLYSFYVLVVSSYVTVLTIYGCLIFLLKFNVAIMPPMSKNFFFILILEYMVVGFISFVSVLNKNFRIDSENKALQNKILSTQLQLKEQELHYLKRQIHPHFLFNTLNTLYGFALQQSKQTPDIILKLSNLLDYILYQINKPKVSLQEEVLHIKEYIDLEKMRFQDTLNVDFKMDDIDKNIQVAPMLLIPFVENAFKHGNIINGFLHINIQVKLESNQLSFNIDNSIKQDDNAVAHKGIGLENIKKRLDLHYTSKGYQLTPTLEKNLYKVSLTIYDLNLLQNV
ncbi:sensor histidine kinase [Labilibacter marinus]|uniref:sensor histidine kinase n=1 Tax=Labilibacter marinus TaxID=1477105 RepID=UPI00095020B0|nr:histidine kinase [Labilibacter marinus]